MATSLTGNWLEVCFIKGHFNFEYLSIFLERDRLIFYLSDIGLVVNTLGSREEEGVLLAVLPVFVGLFHQKYFYYYFGIISERRGKNVHYSNMFHLTAIF